jgi:hypothetical protein
MILIEEKDERFYIAESTQPDAGRGLFAARDIKEGEDLEVIGVAVDRGSPADVCTSYADAYKFAADYSDSFTRHIIPMGYAGIVNHANEEADRNVEIKYVRKGGKTVCVYRFLKDVGKGEEVLGDYGDAWRGLADWSRRVNDSADADEEREWRSFLSLGLYNLGRLNRPGEEDA